MFRPLFFFMLAISVAFTAIGQSNTAYIGTWEGKLNVGAEIRIIFHIRDNGKAGLVATADSPDQSALGLPCDSTYIDKDGINIEMRSLHATYRGKLVNDSMLDGNFTQRIAIPLSLRKVEKVTERKRPQTPVPPFPYEVFDVEYDNADKSVHFGATLTVPKPDSTIRYIKAPEYPVAILITGSGQQDRDETILGHKPFAVIADYLTRRGYAVLRVDDRGTGKTKGSLSKATSEDYAIDVEAGIEFLKTRKEIDKNKIGLIGHSEGGMIAPIVASRRKDINFIILLAGPGIPIIDLMAEQNAAVLRSDSVSPGAVNSFIPIYKKTNAALMSGSSSTTAKLEAFNIVEKWAKKTKPALLKELNLADSVSRRNYINQAYAKMNVAWFNYFIRFDPQPYLRKVQSKILALNGTRDIQVIAASNLAGIRKATRKNKSGAVDIKALDGLNHLFQHCTKCNVSEYGELEETFSPEALKIIGDWLDKNVGK